MAEILQKVSRSEKSICPKCFHYHVCLAIDNQPCFDCNQFVEVVRCKDCKHYVTEDEMVVSHCRLFGAMFDDDDFCSYGERKDND